MLNTAPFTLLDADGKGCLAIDEQGGWSSMASMLPHSKEAHIPLDCRDEGCLLSSISEWEEAVVSSAVCLCTWAQKKIGSKQHPRGSLSTPGPVLEPMYALIVLIATSQTLSNATTSVGMPALFVEVFAALFMTLCQQGCKNLPM